MRSVVFIALIAATLPAPALAHGGEDHAAAPGSEAAHTSVAGPIEVSEAAQRNLGLAVEPAALRPIETTLRVIGEIAADPERSGAISSRISGRVSAVFAQEGERVEKGKRLVEVESRLLGDPPPRVQYASPISGVVVDRHVVIGDDVDPSQHLFEVADLTEVLAIGQVFEGQIGQVAIGQKVRVEVPSYPGELSEGVIERLGSTLDEESRTLGVFARVRNPEGRLRPHMRASMSLITSGGSRALAIPKAALLGEGGQRFAFVQSEDRPDRFERRELVVGVSDDRYVEVVAGLAPGERVVIEGNYSLQYLTPIAEPKSDGAVAGTTGAGGTEEGAGTWRVGALLWALGAAVFAGAALIGARAWRSRAQATPEVR